MKLAQRYNAEYNKQISLTFLFLATKSLRGTCLPERGCAIFSIYTRLKLGDDSISWGGLSLKHVSRNALLRSSPKDAQASRHLPSPFYFCIPPIFSHYDQTGFFAHRKPPADKFCVNSKSFNK